MLVQFQGERSRIAAYPTVPELRLRTTAGRVGWSGGSRLGLTAVPCKRSAYGLRFTERVALDIEKRRHGRRRQTLTV